MSNITITNNIKEKAKVQYCTGQYYRDRTTDTVYILALHSRQNSYSLIDLRNGRPYSENATQNINDAFCGDEEDFDLIDNVEIVLN